MESRFPKARGTTDTYSNDNSSLRKARGTTDTYSNDNSSLRLIYLLELVQRFTDSSVRPGARDEPPGLDDEDATARLSRPLHFIGTR